MEDSLHTPPRPNRHARRTGAALAARGVRPAEIADRIVREFECRQITGLSRSTRWRLEREGLFPRRRRISPGCSGWLCSEIIAWVAERARAGD
jgi:prophage regulatory protein